MNLFRLLASSAIVWKLFNRCIWGPALAFRRYRSEVIEKRLFARFNSPATVMAGPFQGLKYPFMKSCCSTLPPKLLGTYEAELQPYFLRWKSVNFSQIIDIGAAEGYYAVGLARMFPDATVTAYDTSEEARNLTAELAEANETKPRTTICGLCTREVLLDQDFSGKTLIVCDCEGYELTLFDEELANHLKKCHLIIELHDNPQEGFSARPRLIHILNQTHRVEIVSSLNDDQKSNTYRSAFLNDDPIERQVAFAEKRPFTMDWLICEPITHR